MKPFNQNLKRPTLLLFIYFLLPQVIFTVTCPISQSIAGTTCTITGSETKTSSELSIPTGTRYICFNSNILIDDICSQTLSEGNFFQVNGKYDGLNYKPLLKVYWTSSNSLSLAGINSNDAITDVFSIPQGQPSALQISVYACVDLVYGRIYGAINTPTDSSSGLTSIADYASLPNMDDFTFTFCANSYSAYCTFTKTYFSFPDNSPNSMAVYVWGGLSPILVRSFSIDEGSGTTLSDSSGGGVANFGSGSAAPSWSKTNYGVELTSTSQYISLPAPTFAAGDDLISKSYTIMTWVRLTSTPSADSYIFRHTDSTGSQEKFAVKVASNNMASVVVGGSATMSALPINTGQWSHIVATISLKSDNKNYFTSIVFDGSPITKEGFAPLSTAIPFSASDLLRIGGPTSALATFYQFKIYSPGSHITQSGSCSNSGATYTFGLTQQDLEYTCDNACNGCFGAGAGSCMGCAASSYGIYASSCTSCPSGTSRIDTVCSSCIDNCDSCTTLDTCSTCSSGFQKDSSGQCSNSTEPEALPMTTFAKRSTSASKTATTSSDVSTQVVTVVATGDPVAVQAQVSGRLFVSIQYFKITYSTDILRILKETAPKPGKGDPSYVPNVSDKIKSGITSRNIPSAFSDYGVSSSFILNFWKKMILIAIVSAVIMLLSSIEYGMALNRRSPHKLQILVRELAQNYLLTQLYSVLGEIMLYSTLQYRSLHFSSRSEWFDLIVSLIFLSLVFIVPIWHFQFLNKYQKIKESQENKTHKEILENFQQTNVGVKLFYDLFKDENKYQQSFLIFLAGRDVIFSLLLTLLFDHPLAQMTILLAMNIAMISYLLVLKPFKNVFNLAQQLFYEALFFVALITLILLIAVDTHYPNDQDSRETLSRIIIYETLIFKYGTLVITGLKVGMMVLEAIKDYKKKKALPPPEAKQEAKPEAKRLETEGALCLPNGESSPPRKIEDRLDGDMDEEGYPMAMLSPQGETQPVTFARMSTQNSPVHSRYQNNAHAGALQNENTDVIDISPMNYRDQKGFNEEPSPNNYEQNALIRPYSPNENNDYSPIEMRERKNFNQEPPRTNDNYNSANHSRHQSNFNQEEPYQNNYQQEPYQNNYQQERPYDHENDYASIDMRHKNDHNEEEPPRYDNDNSRNHSGHQSNYQQEPYQNNNYQQDHPYQNNYQQDHPYQNNNYQQDHPYQNNNYQQDHPYQNNNYQQDHPYQNNDQQDHPYQNNNYQQEPYQNNYYQQDRPYSENRSDGPQYSNQ